MNMNPTNAVQAYQGTMSGRTNRTAQNRPMDQTARNDRNEGTTAVRTGVNPGAETGNDTMVRRQQDRNRETAMQATGQPGGRDDTAAGRNNTVRLATYGADRTLNESNGTAAAGTRSNRIDLRA